MPFPAHIARVLDEHRIQPATKAALYDLYVSLGAPVLEVFSDIAVGSDPSLLGVDVTTTIRSRVVEAYLRRNHPKWLAGSPTPSLWHPRDLEGRAAGMAVPHGPIDEGVRAIIPENQPIPAAIVVMGRNAHYGGRQETISFDLVASDLEEAVAIGSAMGQQHTIPGSVGETSATFDAQRSIALVWEVQPNVYKPAGERNRGIAKTYRRHRNWHLLTLATTLQWLRARASAVYALRGAALPIAHEVNREKPVVPEIAAHHDRTLEDVAAALGMALQPISRDDEFLLLESIVMNHALRRHVLEHGGDELIWRIAPRRDSDGE